MWTTSLLMVPLALASASTATHFEAGARVEARVRDDQAMAGDLELTPHLGLEHLHHTLTLRLQYAPRLLLPVLAPAASRSAASVLHDAELAAQWRTGLVSQLRAVQKLQLGANTFDALAASPAEAPAPLEPLPLGRVQQYLQSDTALSWETALSLRARLALSAGYRLSGGLDEASRAALPLQQGPRAEAQLGYALTRRDQLATRVSAMHASFSSGERATTAELLQGWQRQLSRSVQGSLGLGMAAVGSVLPDGLPRPLRLLPAGAAELVHTPLLEHQRLSTRLSGRLAPFVDRLTGEASARLEAALALSWAPITWLELGARAAAAQSVQTVQSDTPAARLGQLEAGASYLPHPGVALSAGVRAAWQARAPGPSSAPPEPTRFQSGGFVTLSVFTREVL